MAGYAGSGQDPGGEPDNDATSTPRWVKGFGIIALVLIVTFVVLHLTIGSPASHAAS